MVFVFFSVLVEPTPIINIVFIWIDIVSIEVWSIKSLSNILMINPADCDLKLNKYFGLSSPIK